MSRASDFVQQASYPTAEIELPSQRKVVIRRPPLQAWIMAGLLPPFFTGEVREAWRRAYDIGGAFDGSADRVRDSLAIMRGLAKWAFVDPRLEDGADGSDGAVDPTFLTEDDWRFVTDFIVKGSPSVTIQMAEGEVKVEDLSRFHSTG
jgi:hypothetical protein